MQNILYLFQLQIKNGKGLHSDETRMIAMDIIERQCVIFWEYNKNLNSVLEVGPRFESMSFIVNIISLSIKNWKKIEGQALIKK